MCVPFTGSEAWTRSLGYKVIDEWRHWLVDGQVSGYVSNSCLENMIREYIQQMSIYNIYVDQCLSWLQFHTRIRQQPHVSHC